MKNKELFTLYVGKEIGQSNFNIHVELNLENLVPENKINGILTDGELKQLEEITLAIFKRVNKINGIDELKMPDLEKLM